MSTEMTELTKDLVIALYLKGRLDRRPISELTPSNKLDLHMHQ